MYRIYILPMVLDVLPNGKRNRHAKYVDLLPYDYEIVRYGADAVCVCSVIDISTAAHSALVGNSDVMALPENLDQNMSTGAVTLAQAFLESLNIPAGWLNTSRTYRQVIKVVIGLFQFIQRWNGISIESGQGSSSPFKEGMNLDTRYSQMNQATKVRLRDCFDTLKINRTMLTNTSTIRDALIEFGFQFATRKIKLAGEVI